MRPHPPPRELLGGPSGADGERDRAETADIKLCVLPLDELFPTTPSTSPNSASTPAPRIDPLTLSLIDQHTLIVLNKLDARAEPPTAAQLSALEAYLRREGKSWAAAAAPSEDGLERAFAIVSVRDGRGLARLAERLKGEVKRRCVPLSLSLARLWSARRAS